MSDKKNKSKPDGSVPHQIVNQLVEHTVGGFILFYFNQETGEPEHIMTFDTPAHSLALQKYISDWQAAIEQVNFDNSVNAIQQGIALMDEEPPEDEDEGDEQKK
jgi:hypothetical protein